MTVLSRTGLSLVVAKEQGHNPIRAVGVLLCHLAHVCHHTVPRTAQIWNLKVAQKNHVEVSGYLDEIAAKTKTSVARLLADNRLPAGELRRAT